MDRSIQQNLVLTNKPKKYFLTSGTENLFLFIKLNDK